MLCVMMVQRNGKRNGKVRCTEKNLNVIHQVLKKRCGDEGSARR